MWKAAFPPYFFIYQKQNPFYIYKMYLWNIKINKNTYKKLNKNI